MTLINASQTIAAASNDIARRDRIIPISAMGFNAATTEIIRVQASAGK